MAVTDTAEAVGAHDPLAHGRRLAAHPALAGLPAGRPVAGHPPRLGALSMGAELTRLAPDQRSRGRGGGVADGAHRPQHRQDAGPLRQGRRSSPPRDQPAGHQWPLRLHASPHAPGTDALSAGRGTDRRVTGFPPHRGTPGDPGHGAPDPHAGRTGSPRQVRRFLPGVPQAGARLQPAAGLPPAAAAVTGMNSRPVVVALSAIPNTGKSTLFNRLTGGHQSTGNWPGVSVEKKSGRFGLGEFEVELVDLPGAYSLSPATEEEKVVRNFFLESPPDLVLNLLDARNLYRGLGLTLQMALSGLPMVVAVNMIDEARKAGLELDLQALSEHLGVPVVAISARSGEGIPQLLETLYEAIKSPRPVRPPRISCPPPVRRR